MCAGGWGGGAVYVNGVGGLGGSVGTCTVPFNEWPWVCAGGEREGVCVYVCELQAALAVHLHGQNAAQAVQAA